MRLLCVLGLCCLLSNEALWGYDEIYESYTTAERRVEWRYDNPAKRKKLLNQLSVITEGNFFLFLHMYACAKTCSLEDEVTLYERKIAEIDPSRVRLCLFFFESIFCKKNIEEKHRINFTAAYCLPTRVCAMIEFLKRATVLPPDEKEEIIGCYEKSLAECSKDPEDYKEKYVEDFYGSDWTNAVYPNVAKEWERLLPK